MGNLKIVGTFTLVLCAFGLCSSASYASSILVTVVTNGGGSGTVTSSPAGIKCPGTCSAPFASGTAITLTVAVSSGSTFGGWSGPCSGLATTCNITPTANTTVTAKLSGNGLNSLSHIIFLAQENRSLDNYFGAMREYWSQNGYPDQSFDGLAQFNPTSGAPPLKGPAPAIPGCNPADPPPSDCIFDTSVTVTSFHFTTVCNENTSPSWNEAHVDWNFNDQVGRYPPAKNNGFVKTAGHDARTNSPSPFFDVNGHRAMGYWDGKDLNYYYFLASKFGTSDRWFNPEMARTNPNREYLLAATSHGYAYPNGSDANDTALLKGPTIFESLQNAGVSWKIYVNPQGTSCTSPYTASCLMKYSYLHNFTFAKTVISTYPKNIAPISQYFTDLTNGTLPAVALIEPASNAGLDEHGSDTDKVGTNVQKGAKYVSTLINALMTSSSWKSSAFVLTFDEAGGMYDHVSPQHAVSPDGIKPVDLHPGDVCTSVTGPTCDFVYTGYRVPLILVSPYAKKNYVSHTVADNTAILKFIETRFHLAALTQRDAAQMDMTEFFEFSTPPWLTPPTPPVQNTSNPCYLDHTP